MRHRRRRDSWNSLTTVAQILVLLLAVGSALVALLHAINPQWLDLWVQLVQRILTRPGAYDG